eukprot:834658_1
MASTIPDHIAKFFMNLVIKQNQDVDLSYNTLKQSYLRLFPDEANIDNGKLLQWKSFLINKAQFNPCITAQSLESIIASVDNSLRIHSENAQINQTPKACIQLNIIHTQQIQNQTLSSGATQNIEHATIMEQQIIFCDFKRYQSVSISCIPHGTPLICILPGVSKFNKGVLKGHCTQKACRHDNNEFSFICDTCHIIRNEDDDVSNGDEIFKCKYYPEETNQKKKMVISTSWFTHLWQKHRLTKHEYSELKQREKEARKRKQNENDMKDMNPRKVKRAKPNVIDAIEHKNSNNNNAPQQQQHQTQTQNGFNVASNLWGALTGMIGQNQNAKKKAEEVQKNVQPLSDSFANFMGGPSIASSKQTLRYTSPHKNMLQGVGRGSQQKNMQHNMGANLYLNAGVQHQKMGGNQNAKKTAAEVQTNMQKNMQPWDFMGGTSIASSTQTNTANMLQGLGRGSQHNMGANLHLNAGVQHQKMGGNQNAKKTAAEVQTNMQKNMQPWDFMGGTSIASSTQTNTANMLQGLGRGSQHNM